MADTIFPLNDPLAVEVWGRKLYNEALKATEMMKFVGDTPDSVIQVRDELSASAGAKITYGLRMQLNGPGVTGDATLEGNEESLTRHTDSIIIDQLRHAVKVVGSVSQQRVPFSVRAEGESGLGDWWTGRIDTSMFNQLGGNTGQSLINYTGLQGTNAPSTTAGNSRHLIADRFTDGAYVGAGTNEATIGGHVSASNKEAPFRLELIDRAVVKARTLSPAIRPIKLNGMTCYAQFVHPHQVLQLRQNSTSGQWLDIQKAAMTGGLVSKNPIFTGALGMYNNTILHDAVRCPFGSNAQIGANTNTDLGAAAAGTTDIARSIFVGAQAGAIAFGRSYGYTGGNIRFKWVEVLRDYENQLGISAALVWGMKKTRFNGNDFGSIVVSSVSPGV